MQTGFVSDMPVPDMPAAAVTADMFNQYRWPGDGQVCHAVKAAVRDAASDILTTFCYCVAVHCWELYFT